MALDGSASGGGPAPSGAGYHRPHFFSFTGDFDDFPTWYAQTTAHFTITGLDPTKDDDSAKIYSVLTMSLAGGSAAPLIHRVKAGQGKELWTKLKETYAPDDPAHLHQLTTRLRDLTLDDYDSMTAYLDGVNTLLSTIRLTGTKTFKSVLLDARITVLRNLPKDFASILGTTISESVGDGQEEKAWETLDMRIRTYIRTMGDPLDSDRRSRSLHAGRGRRDDFYDDFETGFSNMSFSAGRRGRGRGPPTRSGARGGGGRPRDYDDRCWTCNRRGHIARNCPDNPETDYRHGRPRGTRGGRGRGRDGRDYRGGGSDRDADAGRSFSARPKVSFLAKALAARPAFKDDEVVLAYDTGSTDHIICDRELLSGFQAQPDDIEVAGGEFVRSAGFGVASLTAVPTSDGSLIDIELRDAQLLDKGVNLLSGTKLRQQGHVVVIDNDPRIELASGLTLPLEEHGGLLWLRGRALREPARALAASTTTASASVRNSDDLTKLLHLAPLVRHQRLGHVNARDMERIGALGKDEELPFCPDCPLGKARQVSLPKAAAPRDLGPGELTHIDLNGPCPKDFWGGKYACVIVDDATRFARVYIMEKKSQAIDCFKDYCDWMAQCGFRIKDGAALQIDNDKVLDAGQFLQYCKAAGIRQQASNPYLHGQHGVVERISGDILDKARTMLMTANLPTKYWGLAMEHAAYVRNCLPTSAKGHESPYKLLLKRDPPLEALRVFGAEAYAYQPPDLRGKWDPKARRGVYVGRSERQKGDLIFFADTNTVSVRGGVTYNESFADLSKSADEGVKQAYDEDYDYDLLFPPADFSTSTEPTDAAATPPAVDEQDKDKDQAAHVVDQGVTTRSKTAATRAEAKLEKDPLLMDFSDADSDDEEIMFDSKRIVSMLAHHTTLGDPATYKAAMSSPEAKQWADAILDESTAVWDNGTFKLLKASDVPRGANVLGSKYVFKTKRDLDGKVERYKARLVVLGCRQRFGIDFDESYAPVAQLETLRVVAVLSASAGWTVHQMDVKNAFLAADIDTEIYAKLPKGWPTQLPGDIEHDVVKLCRSLYGLKQAPYLWNKVINDWLVDEAGFTLIRSRTDSCLYISKDCTLVIVLYVDDLCIAGQTREIVDDFKSAITSRFKMKDLGQMHHCLGLRFRFDGHGGVSIDQERHILDMLQRFGMDSANPVSTPLPPGTELVAPMDSELLDKAMHRRYREIVGSLLYLSGGSRPDIAVAVNQLSRFMSKPGSLHMSAAKHLLRYLRGTSKLGLSFGSTADDELVGYTDATWGSEPTERRSVSGYVFMLNGAAVSWSAKLQKTISLSTAEAEFMALTEGVREAMFLRGMLCELGYDTEEPTLIFVDNQPALHLANNMTTSGRSKHFAIRMTFVRDEVKAGTVRLEHKPTGDMLADMLTKILPRPQHRKLRDIVMGQRATT